MLDYNGFEGLHQYRFSFIYRSLLVWWNFRLAARHFTDSSLKWSFFYFPEQSLVLGEISDFFCVIIFRLFMEAKSSSWKSALFLPIIANCVHANIGICVHVWTWIYFFTKLKHFCCRMRLEQNSQDEQTLEFCFGNLDGFFWTKSWIFFKIAAWGKFLECVSNYNFPKNRKTFGWDLFTHVERAVPWIFRTYDANLISIRSFS